MKHPPLFIVFEGIDGSGKSTQARLAHHAMDKRGLPSILLCEPTGGPWGKKIRTMLSGNTPFPPQEQHRLFLLDREEDAALNISPNLSNGTTIVMDRYYFSNAAYQGAAGLSPDSILEDNRRRDFPVPDRVYLIDIPPEEAIKRISLRNNGDSSERFERRHFLESVRSIYLSIADDSFRIIDGLPGEREIHHRIIDDLSERFHLP